MYVACCFTLSCTVSHIHACTHIHIQYIYMYIIQCYCQTDFIYAEFVRTSCIQRHCVASRVRAFTTPIGLHFFTARRLYTDMFDVASVSSCATSAFSHCFRELLLRHQAAVLCLCNSTCHVNLVLETSQATQRHFCFLFLPLLNVSVSVPFELCCVIVNLQ